MQGKEKVYVVGKTSRVYSDNRQLFLSVFSQFEIIELRHYEILSVPKFARVLVFAYSQRHLDNRRMADHFEKGANKCLYFLSASSLSIFYKCFRYSRIKRKQLDYLRRQNSAQNCLCLFGAFAKIDLIGNVPTTDKSMLETACRTFISDNYGVHLFFDNRKQKYSQFHRVLIYSIQFLFGGWLGAAILKLLSSYVYGYSDAHFYIEDAEWTIGSFVLVNFVFLWNFCAPFAWVTFLVMTLRSLLNTI